MCVGGVSNFDEECKEFMNQDECEEYGANPFSGVGKCKWEERTSDDSTEPPVDRCEDMVCDDPPAPYCSQSNEYTW